MTCARCGKPKYPYQTDPPAPPFYCTLCRTRPWTIRLDPYPTKVPTDWAVHDRTPVQELKQIAKEVQSKRGILNIPETQPFVRIYAQDSAHPVVTTLQRLLKLVIVTTPREPSENGGEAS